MLCCVVLCCVMLCHVMLCCVVLCCAVLCCVMLCCVMLCYVMLCYVMLCYVMLCYVMLRCVVFCYVILRYVTHLTRSKTATNSLEYHRVSSKPEHWTELSGAPWQQEPPRTSNPTEAGERFMGARDHMETRFKWNI